MPMMETVGRDAIVRFVVLGRDLDLNQFPKVRKETVFYLPMVFRLGRELLVIASDGVPLSSGVGR